MRLPVDVAARYLRRTEDAIKQRRLKLALHKDRLPAP
jgi:hypothetical protein